MCHLEFILHTYEGSEEKIKNALSEFGRDLQIAESVDAESAGRNFIVQLNTDDPTVIFDLCAQFGRIRSVRVDEA